MNETSVFDDVLLCVQDTSDISEEEETRSQQQVKMGREKHQQRSESDHVGRPDSDMVGCTFNVIFLCDRS